MLIAAPIGAAASQVGTLIMWATEQAPFLMGILVSVIVGVALTPAHFLCRHLRGPRPERASPAALAVAGLCILLWPVVSGHRLQADMSEAAQSFFRGSETVIPRIAGGLAGI